MEEIPDNLREDIRQLARDIHHLNHHEDVDYSDHPIGLKITFKVETEEVPKSENATSPW
ncbi:hypothetical protein OJ996_05040 [Luteolibacter sp. GHJ8]|uniref:Uncharacterized protein n=1 Tax=Luteolibacter rhizosphaerae TaxID=2989719 RepID=A0ABT3FZC6_9BACT|nr:hypothetical protein [Luteolibacter rhizosphaerae]MCW1912926.1 hypothetical protein [Luteolibacter rhizosphaerae]